MEMIGFSDAIICPDDMCLVLNVPTPPFDGVLRTSKHAGEFPLLVTDADADADADADVDDILLISQVLLVLVLVEGKATGEAACFLLRLCTRITRLPSSSPSSSPVEVEVEVEQVAVAVEVQYSLDLFLRERLSTCDMMFIRADKFSLVG